MASTPQHLTLEEHRDDHHRVELVVRWLVVGVLTLFAVLGLANVFGQNPVHSTGTGEAATLDVSGPSRLRGGLFYQGRFSIHAKRELEHATLLLDSGWFDSMHINSYSPEPLESGYRNGKLVLDYGHVAAGDTLVARLQLQVNPTNVAFRSQGVELHDGETPVAAVARDVWIFP